jgi:putative FmdB family regulatory protein
MPTYEYRCPDGHDFELIQKMTGRPRAKCPKCGQAAIRIISGGAGLIFKGSGFYITDYGKDGKGPRKETDSEPKVAPTVPEPKSAETKPVETKPEPPPKASKSAKKKGSR